MPRGKIELANHVESLTILDADGKVDETLDPKLSDKELKILFKGMLTARRYDERMLKLQRQGRIGTYGPAMGQEAAAMGPAFVIDAEDWFVPSFREPAGMLYRGWPMERLMLWWGGNEIGSTVPKGMNDMPICVPVSSQCLYAAGIAWGLKLDGKKRVAVAFVGDGGTSEGDFHEAMNVAGAFELPLVMIIQNNQWAISLPRRKQTASETLAQKAIAYGMNGIQADGNDVLSMVVATREAVANARAGKGPSIIEAVTYRLGVHTTADDPKKYRSDKEVEEWKKRDPLTRFWRYLSDRKIMDEKARDLLEAEIGDEITAAVEKSEAYESDVTEPFRHCFAEMPANLTEQYAEFSAFMNGSNGSPQAAPERSHQSVH